MMVKSKKEINVYTNESTSTGLASFTGNTLLLYYSNGCWEVEGPRDDLNTHLSYNIRLLLTPFMQYDWTIRKVLII